MYQLVIEMYKPSTSLINWSVVEAVHIYQPYHMPSPARCASRRTSRGRKATAKAPASCASSHPETRSGRVIWADELAYQREQDAIARQIPWKGRQPGYRKHVEEQKGKEEDPDQPLDAVFRVRMSCGLRKKEVTAIPSSEPEGIPKAKHDMPSPNHARKGGQGSPTRAPIESASKEQ